MALVPTDQQTQAEAYRLLMGTEYSSKVVVGCRPLCVFAAGRASFDVIINTTDEDYAVALLFDELPLAENGWDLMTAKATLLPYKTAHDGNIWHVERQ